MESDGTIHAVMSAEMAAQSGIENIKHYAGNLIPGFINTHCHLELSHLFQRIPQHTGLQGFVQQVIKFRSTPDAEVLAAMEIADQNMYANGIVAVGDISNGILSKDIKLKSKIVYHTFVETMGFNPAQALAIMTRAILLKETFAPLRASIVPHAPYSVSPALFAGLKEYSESGENLLSMHNQETADENLFFEKKEGSFLKLYEFLGLDISAFPASGKSSLQTVLPQMPQGKTLLVHNTLTTAADISFAEAMNNNLFWCVCANANLYIEDKLPDVHLWKNAGLKVTLGTDSLASNHQLSILSEMRVLQENLTGPGIVFDDLLLWATLNGAEFLGLADTLGSLAPGKKPGIVLLEGMDGEQINLQTTLKRLI